jgi:hypothetical protein
VPDRFDGAIRLGILMTTTRQFFESGFVWHVDNTTFAIFVPPENVSV